MLDELTAVECLRRLEAGELSAVELARETLSRLEAASELNAVAALDEEATLAAAAEADAARAAGSEAPLLGLPLTIKDTIAVAGLPFRSGSLARENNIAHEDSTVVARLRRAGAVVAAKTAVPEYAWSYETESALQGRTLNAFDPARTSGGSSGGEGALIGRGASIAGLGTDGGGSIRVPSHYNGIVGLRPTAGLVPETGGWPTTRDTGMLDMVCIGPMARSVGDVALLLRTIAGRDGHDPFVSVDGYTGDHRAIDTGSLRVGFYAQDGVWPASAETDETVRRAAAALEDAGAAVDEVVPPPLEEAEDVFFRMMAADGGARARADLAPAGGRHIDQMLFVLEMTKDFAVDAEGFFQLLGRWESLRSPDAAVRRRLRPRPLARDPGARAAPRLPARRRAARVVPALGERDGILDRRDAGRRRSRRDGAGDADRRPHRRQPVRRPRGPRGRRLRRGRPRRLRRGQRSASFRSTQLKFVPPSAHNPRLILCPSRPLSHKEDRFA